MKSKRPNLLRSCRLAAFLLLLLSAQSFAQERPDARLIQGAEKEAKLVLVDDDESRFEPTDTGALRLKGFKRVVIGPENYRDYKEHVKLYQEIFRTR